MREHIHESNLIEGFNSKTADDLSLIAWRFLLKENRIKAHKLLNKITAS